MPTTLQFRRGTTAQNGAFTGSAGELSIDSDKNTLRVHDGSTAGGNEIVDVTSEQTLINKTVAGVLLTERVNVQAHMVPTADVTYDLGSANNAWRDLYLSGNTINLGGASISYDAATGFSFKDESDESAAVVLDSTGVVANTYGSAALVPVLTIGEDGRVTNASSVSVAGVSTFTYTDANTTFTIGTADGGSYSATIGAGSITSTELDSTGVTANTYGSAALVPVITVDEDGRVTNASSVSVAGVSTFTYADANATFTIGTADGGSFDATIGSGSITSTELDSTGVTANTYGSASLVPVITIDEDGRVTNASSVSVAGVSSFNYSSGNTTFTIGTADGGSFDATLDLSTLTVSAGDGLEGGGNLSSNVTISHGNTSSQASVNNSGRTYIQDITLDAYGHITGVASATETVTDTTYTAGNNMVLSGTEFSVNTTPTFSHTDLTPADPGPAHEEGRIYYNDEYKALTVYTDVSDVSLQVGLEEWVRVYNDTGNTIPNGTPVYATGAFGETPTIAPADATTETKARVLGIATHDIADTTSGFIATRGLVSGIDTSALSAGEAVHLGADGSLQNSAPTYPYYAMDVGRCIVSSNTNGYIYVSLENHVFEQFRVTGNEHIDGNLTVEGNFTVNGTQSIVSQTNLSIDDSFIYLNTGDAIGESGTSSNTSGLDDAYFTGYFEGTDTTTYYVRIDGVGTGTGGVDTFEWSKDDFSTTEATGVDITGSPQALDNNINIFFNATTGHTSGDTWSGTASPTAVDTGWATNRNTGNTGVGYTHMGVFFDVSDDKFKFFDEYDPEVSGNIDTGHASFNLGTVVAASFEGTASNSTQLNGEAASYYLNYDNFVNTPTIPSSGVDFDPVGTDNSTDVTLAGSYDYLTIIDQEITLGQVDATTDISGLATVATSGAYSDLSGTPTLYTTANANTDIDARVTQAFVNALNVDADTLDGNDTSYFRNASNLNAGTVPTARLGSGTANSTTFLAGDNTFKTLQSGVTVANDTSTNATRYVTFSDQTSGTETTLNVSSTKLTYNPSTGTLAATDFNSTSDAALKENVETIENASNKISSLRGVNFNWKDNGNYSMGVIAQEVEQVIPEVVTTDPEGQKAVNYQAMVGVLIEAVKDLQNQVNELKG